MKQTFFSVGIPLLCLLSNEYWQFDLWFLYLFKTQVYIWKFLVHVLLKLSLKDFLSITLLACEMSAIVQ